MFWRGLRFGMFLQLAVGPVWLFVFQTAGTHGIAAGLSGAVGAMLIDGLYIALSGLGVAALMERPGVQRVVKLLGCAVLVLFGINTLLGCFDLSLLPSLSLLGSASLSGAFWQTLLLTASSPMTILLWSGVFSTQVVELGLSRQQIVFYGLGCLCATPIGLTIASLLGSVCRQFFPALVIQILNGVVGAALILFGVRMVAKKATAAPSRPK